MPQLSAHAGAAALSSRLVDALLVGMGLVLPELEFPYAKGPITRAVLGGRAVFVRSVEEAPFVVWAGSRDKHICYFCSCSKDENVRARVRTATSSSCHHAEAYKLALWGVCKHVLCLSTFALLQRFPDLDNSTIKALDVDAVEVQKLKDSAAIHVVGYNRFWCVVHTPAARTRKVRPVFQSMPCRTRNAHCIHSLAEKPPVAGYGGFEDGEGVGGCGPDGVSNASEDRDADGAGEGSKADGEDGGDDVDDGDGGGDGDPPLEACRVGADAQPGRRRPAA